MQRKHLLKYCFLVPIATMPLGFLSNCSKKEEPVVEFMIIQPSNEESLTQIQKLTDGSVTFLYKNFKYTTDIPNFNETKFSVRASGFSDYALNQSGKCIISVVNWDEISRTFDIEISFSDVFTSSDPIKTNFIFYYDNNELKSDKPEYNLYLTGEAKKPKIYSSSFEKITEKIYSGTFYYLAKGFSYEGIKNIDNLSVEITNISNVANSDSEYFCDIINIDKTNRKFDLAFRGCEMADGDFNLSIQFKLNSTIIASPQEQFSFSLEDEHITRDFRQENWDGICSLIRREGLSGLQNTYNIKSFVGLRKKIVLKDDQTYYVRVIGQNHDELVNKDTSEGSCAALTFMFDEIITIKDSINPYQIVWDNTHNIWKYLTTKEANIRKWLNNEFLSNYLPSYVSSWIPRVTKKTVLHLTRETAESDDYIWLPSLIEIGGLVDKNQTELLNEGYCYDYFKNFNSNDSMPRREKKTLGGTTNINYWLRSPSLTATKSNIVYGCVNGALIANMEYFLITNQCAIVPCFCI